jgi:hypothetical protein
VIEHPATVHEKNDGSSSIILARNRERRHERQCGEKAEHVVLVVG